MRTSTSRPPPDSPRPAGVHRSAQLDASRGRLARLLTVRHLAEWGFPYDSEAAHSAALITAELAADAVRQSTLNERITKTVWAELDRLLQPGERP